MTPVPHGHLQALLAAGILVVHNSSAGSSQAVSPADAQPPADATMPTLPLFRAPVQQARLPPQRPMPVGCLACLSAAAQQAYAWQQARACFGRLREGRFGGAQVAPLAGNWAVLGWDLHSDGGVGGRTRRAAMDAALVAGAPTCTGLLQLPQDATAPRASSLVFAPMQRSSGAALGMAAVTFSWDQLLNASLPPSVLGLARLPNHTNPLVASAAKAFPLPSSGQPGQNKHSSGADAVCNLRAALAAEIAAAAL